tara:strand:- start:217 stop:351 length:135 start_codon:yes stop_codon:yes gene_type:complete
LRLFRFTIVVIATVLSARTITTVRYKLLKFLKGSYPGRQLIKLL